MLDDVPWERSDHQFPAIHCLDHTMEPTQRLRQLQLLHSGQIGESKIKRDRKIKRDDVHVHVEDRQHRVIDNGTHPHYRKEKRVRSLLKYGGAHTYNRLVLLCNPFSVWDKIISIQKTTKIQHYIHLSKSYLVSP